jgi:hypothetical protein
MNESVPDPLKSRRRGEEKYTARELVDMTLKGHYCIRDEIDSAIRRIYRMAGRRGKEEMHKLPDLKAYASEPEIDEWQDRLLELDARVKGEVEASGAEQERRSQPLLFEEEGKRRDE